MNWDEFSFFNQQLAGMLKSGIPLERSLKQICQSLRSSRWRGELELLEQDLAKGLPLREAIALRNLPSLYKRMVVAGVEGNDLPGMLTLLADYYRHLDGIWMRLKGLMVYPAILFVTSLVIFIFLAMMFSNLADNFLPGFFDQGPVASSTAAVVSAWMVVACLAAAGALFALALAIPRARDWMRWRLPGFREASYSQFAATIALMLRSGTGLRDALGFARELELGSVAGTELARWERRLSEGHGTVQDMAAGGTVFPPLFVWLVAQSGENVTDGFARAAQIYFGRATFKVEMMLYAALPVSILFLGLLVFGQGFTLLRVLIRSIDILGGPGGASNE